MNNLWTQTCAEAFNSHPLQGDHTADLVIIGGGFTGCAAALQAAGQGARVILLEAATIGYGGSGRNVGLVNAGLWLPPDQVCAQMGQAAGDRLNSALAAGPDLVFDLIDRHAIQCEPVRQGTLHCAHSANGLKDLQSRLSQQKARKAPVDLINTKDAAQATGSKSFYGALRDQRAGTVQPLAYVTGLARAAVQAGASLHENSAVTHVARSADWTVRTQNGTVTAKALLVATDSYHRKINGLRTTSLSPVNFFQLATRPLPDDLRARILPGGEGCWDTGLVMKSFRLDQAGRFIFGAMGLPDRLGIHQSWARRALSNLFPELADQEFTHFWAGRIGMTNDHIPRLLRLGKNGFAVFGFSGRGIAPGTVLGSRIAESLACGNEDCLPIRPVESYADPLALLKGLYYESGARVVHLISGR
ncbi:FAD-binding oxidoreductase [Thalassovita sp.]|uniref:NAD(P)/FAD-dependent oxidoreductase n=1 Tax=Thalassovita sp. TaxID=1979401 RepID=UPI0029DE8268|nr:FAD-binding oxidoreductase [Thalassovita sp.]